jgi:hypothetical protein
MASIAGLDQLQGQLAEAQTAMSALNGEVAKLEFNPDDPASVEAAVRTMKRMVDQKAGRYSSNPIVGSFITKSKKRSQRRSAPRRSAPKLSALP